MNTNYDEHIYKLNKLLLTYEDILNRHEPDRTIKMGQEHKQKYEKIQIDVDSYENKINSRSQVMENQTEFLVKFKGDNMEMSNESSEEIEGKVGSYLMTRLNPNSDVFLECLGSLSNVIFQASHDSFGDLIETGLTSEAIIEQLKAIPKEELVEWKNHRVIIQDNNILIQLRAGDPSTSIMTGQEPENPIL